MKKQRILLVGIISVGVIALLILFGWLFRKPLYRLSLGDIDARYRSAMLAYQEHRYADARKELAPLARLDTAKCAQFLLGDLLYRGEGGPADLPEALNLFLMAARQEHVDAQANAGFMYTYGLGTVRISEKPWTGFTGQLSGEIRKLSWEWGIFIRTAGDLYAMNRLLSTGIAGPRLTAIRMP